MIGLAFVSAALGFIVSVAGMVYPFKPFGKRRNALLSSIAMFALFGFIGEAYQPVPDGGSVSSTTAAAGANAPATTSGKTAEQQAAERHAALEEGMQEIRGDIGDGAWAKAGSRFRTLNTGAHEIEEFTAEMEALALARVRPIPASDYHENLAGYRLLATLRPENALYGEKVEEYQGRIDQAKRNAVARLIISSDRVEGITWFHHPNRPRYTNSRSTVYLYIGRRDEDSRAWLRMKVQYAASNWLFVENVVAWHDGIREPLVAGRFQRDNNQTIWEWMDVTPTERQIEILRSLADANEAILRFEGAQYRRDVTLSAGDKRALLEVLEAFEAM